MSGTKAGAAKAAATTKSRHGADFYMNIGKIGGKLGHTGGFATKALCGRSIVTGLHTKPQCAGTKGGRYGKRRKETE